MKTFNWLSLITLLLLITSCDKSGVDSVYISTGDDIYVQNANGDDLLDSIYFMDDIRLYYEVDHQKEAVYNQDLDAPYGFKIVDMEGAKALSVSFNYLSADDHPITYIEWKGSDLDTIVHTWDMRNNASFTEVDSVWYNGVLMLPGKEYGPTEGFVIVK